MMHHDVSRLSVGVVIPAFNAERWIVDALDSVAGQTRSPEAIVVVNDGSVDATAEVVESWIAGALSAIKVQLISHENKGIGGARNTGILALDTELIALLDADDVWKPHHLAMTCEALERHDDLVLCFANHQPFNRDGPIGSPFLSGKTIERLPTEERDGGLTVLRGGVFESLLTGSYISPSTSVLRRSSIHAIGLFDPELRVAEDYDFFLRLAKFGTFGYFPYIHTHYRLHNENMSHVKHSLRMKEFGLAVRLKLLRRSKELSLTDAERIALVSTTVSKCRSLLYDASRHGFSIYFTHAWKCAKAGIWSPILNPKDWLRSLAFLLGYRGRSGAALRS
jgi:glycosyltransferase involved in cell wall biosynthesis